MIELDKSLEPVCRLINECYEGCFPGLPQFPKFSFTRAMITLWKAKVYSRLEGNLAEAFSALLAKERQDEIKLGEQKTAALRQGRSQTHNVDVDEAPGSISVMGGLNDGTGERELMGRFVQSVADISANELKIHFLGSTKVDLDVPYQEFARSIIKQTKYRAKA